MFLNHPNQNDVKFTDRFNSLLFDSFAVNEPHMLPFLSLVENNNNRHAITVLILFSTRK